METTRLFKGVRVLYKIALQNSVLEALEAVIAFYAETTLVRLAMTKG